MGILGSRPEAVEDPVEQRPHGRQARADDPDADFNHSPYGSVDIGP